MSLAQLFYLKASIRDRVRRRFPLKAVRSSSRFTMEPLEHRLLLSATPVAPDLTTIPNATNLEPNPITQVAAPNQAVSVQLDYQDTGTGAGTSGLGLRIHYDSSQLRPGEAGVDGQFGTLDDVAVLTNLISAGPTTIVTGPQDQADSANLDGNADTDRFVLIAWSDFTSAFPKGPTALLMANFTATATFTGSTINFTTSSRPIGRALHATSAEFTLQSGNEVPVLEAIGNKTVDEGAPLTFTIQASDVDLPANTLTYSATNLPPGATFDVGTRTFSWTPTEAQGPNTYLGLTFTVNDGQGGTDSETIAITVNELNQAPVLAAIGDRTGQVGQPLTFTVTATDVDVPANGLTLSSSAVPTGATFDAATGLFSWTPTAGQVGDTSVTFTVTDNGSPGLSDSETLTLRVTAQTNQMPVAQNDGPYVATEDQLLTVPAAQGVLANDSDPDSDPMSATLLAQAANGVVTLASNGGFTYAPTANFTGSDSFRYTLSDGRGGTATATVALTIAASNEAPVLGPIGNQTVDEGVPLTFTIQASDTDLPANTLTYSATNLPPGATFDAATRRFNWTPTEDQGPGLFTGLLFTVTDGQGGTDSETIEITVNEINDAPVLGAIGDRTGQVGQPLTFTVTATDADVPANGLTLSSSALPTGATFDAGTGLFSWTPTPGQVGDMSVTFTVTDNGSPALSDSETLTLKVTAQANQAPVVNDQTFSIAENSVNGTVVGTILATDPDVAQALTYELTGTAFSVDPSTGEITVADSALLNFEATPSFSLTATVTDNGSPKLSNTAVITINVTNVNEAPTVNAATFTLPENSPLNTTVGTVTATDPDADQTLTFSITNGNVDGAFQIDASTGVISVANVAALNIETTPQFILTVLALDNGVPSLTGSSAVTVKLTNMNEGPTITVPATATVPENTATVATVTANDPDAGSTLTFSLSGVDAAKFQLSGTGSSRALSFVNAPDFERPTDSGGNHVYDVTVTVSDGTLSESKAIVVTVTDVNEGGRKPFIIRGTDKSDKIVVKESDKGWLTIRVNHHTSRVQLQQGQELQVLGLDGNDHIVVKGLNRNALIDGGDGNDKIDGHKVTNALASLTLLGGKGNDRLIGGRGNDILRGGTGKDVLIGGKGDDRLNGGPGRDVLVGGPGHDTLIGGGGHDELKQGCDHHHGWQDRHDEHRDDWVKEYVG